MILPPPRSTLFPYTTLFRSSQRSKHAAKPRDFDSQARTMRFIDERRSECPRNENVSGHVSRSEEHTSELQSLRHLVCRLLLEKKKKNNRHHVALIRTIQTAS